MSAQDPLKVAMAAVDAAISPPPPHPIQVLLDVAARNIHPALEDRQEADPPSVPGEGYKNDAGKPPYHLLPQDVLADVVVVLDHGLSKYGPRNWEMGMDWSRLYAAAHRHLNAWWRGEEIDAESGQSHLACAITNLMFLRGYERRKAGNDDRPPFG